MGENSAISWTDHTFNPWMGCSKVSPGCDHCYAEALGKRTGRVQWGDDAERVVTSDGYWRNPIKWNRDALAGVPSVRGDVGRHLVFCASLADVFEARADLVATRQRLFDLIDATPALDWMLLTKRPENVLALARPSWLDAWPVNVWMGTTVEDQERAVERIPHLLAIPAPVRFLSCEPLLEDVDIYWALHDGDGSPCSVDGPPSPFVNWVIVGGESGGKHRPFDPEWARTIREHCATAGVAFFFKQHGGLHPTSGGHELDGETHHAWPVVTVPPPTTVGA